MGYGIKQGSASSSDMSLSKTLEKNKIHNVLLKNVEAKDIKKDDGTVFKVVEFTFFNEDGSYSHTEWELREGDFERKSNGFGGENPSDEENFQSRIKHILTAINPSEIEAIDKGEKKVDFETWDEMRNWIVETCSSADPKQVYQLKLLEYGDKPAIPKYVLGLRKDGSTFMRTNFISSKGKLLFTDREQEKIDQSSSAPTDLGLGGPGIGLGGPGGPINLGDDIL